jgi:hypothetical protein
VDSFREVIHSIRFDAELEAIESDARAADQVVHALTWALCRHPERGFPIPQTSVLMWPVYLRAREYVVYYRVGSTWVELLSISESGEDFAV